MEWIKCSERNPIIVKTYAIKEELLYGSKYSQGYWLGTGKWDKEDVYEWLDESKQASSISEEDRFIKTSKGDIKIPESMDGMECAYDYSKKRQKVLGEEDIEKLASQFAGSKNLKSSQPEVWDDRYRGFIAGYKAALQSWSGVWVKASERLPEVGKKYLVYVTDFGGQIDVFEFSAIDSGRWPHVTHWMPLPLPPNERNDEGS